MYPCSHAVMHPRFQPSAHGHSHATGRQTSGQASRACTRSNTPLKPTKTPRGQGREREREQEPELMPVLYEFPVMSRRLQRQGLFPGHLVQRKWAKKGKEQAPRLAPSAPICPPPPRAHLSPLTSHPRPGAAFVLSQPAFRFARIASWHRTQDQHFPPFRHVHDHPAATRHTSCTVCSPLLMWLIVTSSDKPLYSNNH